MFNSNYGYILPLTNFISKNTAALKSEPRSLN